jgi:two-component system, cell cycle sensor histidine kinase and response regulator CckA
MGQPLPILVGPSETFDPEILQAAVEASPEGMALAEDGRIAYANRAFARLVGHRPPSELRGRALASLRPPGHPCAWTRADGARNTPDNHLCQFVTQGKNGVPSRIESTCSAFRAHGREFLLVTIRDVSVRERRRMVRDGDRRFRTIFDGAPMGIVQCDLQGRVLETNPAVERMLGYSRQELRGMHFRDFTHPEDVGSDLERYQELVDGKRESYELELRYLGNSAVTGWVRLTVSLVRGVDGQPQFAIGMTEEITERKRAEQRLREAQKMEVVGRLVGGVAHDFNNLLTGIMLYCDLLIAGIERGSTLHHHAEEIRMAGEQGAALIQQLLAVSRQQVIEPRILSLNDVIVSTRNLLSRLLGETFELVTRFDGDLGNVKIDPAQVQQILFNLVLNARDAMAQGGSILVETGNCDLCPPDSAVSQNTIPAVMLAVKDTGCGMSAETQSHLFEPFFTTKANGRGNGLGLATVYNIVRNNGGTIEVVSEPGRGTQFIVRLPRNPDFQPDVKPDLRYSPVPVGETILLVEDNVAVRQAAQRVLSECGYVVLEASSGSEAIAVSRQYAGTIDLLLADVVMPGMSGREVARQLCSERPDLKILCMSGYEHDDEVTGNNRDPVVSFRKPFTGAALLDKLRETLEIRSGNPAKKSGKRKREKS